MVYGRETLKVSSLQRAVGKSGNTKGASSNLVDIIRIPLRLELEQGPLIIIADGRNSNEILFLSMGL